MIPLPDFHAPQVALVHAETWTGIVLTLDGRRYIGSGDVYRVFASRDEAAAYARRKVGEDPDVECVIYDETGRELDVIRPAWVKKPG